MANVHKYKLSILDKFTDNLTLMPTKTVTVRFAEFIHTGESCGSGQTLADLRHRVSEQKLKYSCYDVFGDPKNRSQWKDLSICASRIVIAEQQGTTPEPNGCFLAEKEGTIVSLYDATFTLAIVFFRYNYSSWLNCGRCVGWDCCHYHHTVHFSVCILKTQLSCKTFIEQQNS